MDDVRWKQRFENFRKAFGTLRAAVTLARARELSDLEGQGMIQGFEFTHELAWCVLKDYLEHKGFSGIIGSRDATRLAFKNALIADGEVWMDMIKARNQTSHTYNESVAAQITADITGSFFPAFEKMERAFASLYEKEDLPE
jgi:nucleotidyltransferase substrate binding protein (TIGR01987 family)